MSPGPESASPQTPPARRKYVPAIGPRLRLVLYAVFGLVAVLGANSAYLASITFLESLHRPTLYQNYFYQVMFGLHLVLGVLLLGPYLVFGILHMRNAASRPNRRAVRVGYALFIAGVIVLVSGVLLTRIDIFEFKNLGLKDPRWRSAAYWAHVITPLACIWLYVLHRLAGPRIHWKVGAAWAGVVAAVVLAMVGMHSLHPQKSQAASAEGARYFEPSASRTASGNFIPANTLMMDDYCRKCHEDAYQGWFHSAHRFSSFNNPFYLFSVNETRQVSLQRDGSVRASRWCAGCHDPVPFFSGAFDDPRLQGMLAMLDDTVASLRRIAADLRPLMLDDLGLADLERRLLHAVDGRWDLLTLVQHAPVRAAEALVVFARLIDRGIVDMT